MGGYFTSKEWNAEREDPAKIRRAYALAWGYVIREPDEKSAAAGHYRVLLKYRNKRFIQVEAWNDAPAAQVLRTLENGDYALVFGTFVRRFSQTKKAKRRGEPGAWTYCITAEVVLTMELVLWLLRLFSSRWLRERLEEEEGAPDAFEWEGDG